MGLHKIADGFPSADEPRGSLYRNRNIFNNMQTPSPPVICGLSPPEKHTHPEFVKFLENTALRSKQKRIL